MEEVIKEEPKVEVAPVKAEEHCSMEQPVKTVSAEVAPETTVEKETSKEEEIFKIRQPELGAKINVIGQIDLAALNQSTRPKKKSKEEKRREREEKEKIRQDQKKLMKEAIIKEIRKDDSKLQNLPLSNGEESLIGERLHVAGRQAVVHDDEMGSRHAEVLFQAAGTLNPREVLRQAVE